MKVFIYAESIKVEDKDLVSDFFNHLKKTDLNIYVNENLHTQLKEYSIAFSSEGIIINHIDFKDISPEYVITLGGDGTILNAIKWVRDTNVPIIGVNMGRLGFLSSVEKTKMAQIIQGIERNTINYEPRTLLGINSNIPLFIDSPFALNDFTLHKRDTSSMVTIHAAIDGKYLNTYWADGLIVSTPTGSTGYSLACGGPIVFPESSNFVITPIAPHNLNVRPLVISDSAEITLQIEGRSENFLCTLDNRYETVTHEHMVKIKKNDFTITLGTLENTEFMNTIRQKLMWGLDKRN